MFNLSKIEEDVLKFWDEDDTFQKTVDKDAPNGAYTFYDGPPFATGLPHYGHLVGSLMKDVVPRYWTMKGHRVERKWGWDCHGLPIENIVEKELDLNSRKDVVAYGVDSFNKTCHGKVMMYREEWKKTVRRFGRWADMDNDYKTMDIEYMESIWWVFKELYDKGLIYEDYKSMHVCPRCETTLSQSEVAEGYKEIKDLSVVVKFQITNNKPQTNSNDQNSNIKTYILSWTTTPWTLPGNVALAVGEDIVYVVIEKKDEEEGERVRFILAKDRLKDVLGEDEYEIVYELKGSDLVGMSYDPVFPYYANSDIENKENGWKIYAGDFVTTEEGTGVVHIAPAFGQDDMDMGKRHHLPFIQHLGMDGHFKPEVSDFAGLSVKPIDDHMSTDIEIVKYLARNDKLFNKEKYTHTYPHCWRCDTPLLNYATSSLFVNVTRIKDNLLENAKKVSWVPSHMKEGRFGNWLEGARDWSISRQRFWGSVIPLWKCESESCDKERVFGSIEELERASGESVSDLHKHIVDNVHVPCECGKVMKRIPDVLDCWFESGSMPYAQLHYPFENKEKFEQSFPAQFIAEGADQTRAWFYYLHIMGTALFDSNAFENVIVNGIVQAEDGKKMSKKLKNYPEPEVLFDKYGADAVRYYLATSPVVHADDLNFSEKGVAEKARMFRTLHNVASFYEMFSEGVDISDLREEDLTHSLDVWINARLNQTITRITEQMDAYDIQAAARPISEFIDDLSTWYVRRSRDRFKSEDESIKLPALRTLRHVLRRLARIMAPFTPFFAEHIYKYRMGGGVSVHMTEWPTEYLANENRDTGVLDRMRLVRNIVETGLAKRTELKLPVRQPLRELKVLNCEVQIEEEYAQLIKDELNIKEVTLVQGDGGLVVELDSEITPELKIEGIKRELVRQINNIRKNQGLTIKDRVKIAVESDNKDIAKAISGHGPQILEDTLAIEFVDSLDGEKHEVKVAGAVVFVSLKKV